jgi:hypothetical protein
MRGAWCGSDVVDSVDSVDSVDRTRTSLPHPTTVRIITTGTVALLFKPAPPVPVPNALRTTHYGILYYRRLTYYTIAPVT